MFKIQSSSSKYGSRKFLTTLNGQFLSLAALLIGVFANAPDGYWGALGGFFIFQGACVAAYNWANMKTTVHNDA